MSLLHNPDAIAARLFLGNDDNELINWKRTAIVKDLPKVFYMIQIHSHRDQHGRPNLNLRADLISLKLLRFFNYFCYVIQIKHL